MARLCFRLFVAALLLCGALFVRVYFFAFSFPALDERVAAEFHRATGWDIHFGGLEVHLSQGYFDLKDVEIRDPKDPVALTGAARIELEPRWSEWLNPDFSRIRVARVYSPQRIELQIDANGARPTGRIGRLLSSRPAGEGAKAQGSGINLEVESLLIRDADLLLSGHEPDRTWADVENASLSGRWSNPKDFSFSIGGDIRIRGVGELEPWSASIAPNVNGDGWSFSWSMRGVSSKAPYWEGLGFSAGGAKLRLSGRVFRPVPPARFPTVELNLEADRLELVNTESSRTLVLSGLSLASRGSLDASSQTLSLASLNVQTTGMEAAGSGSIGLKAPHPFEARLDRLILPEASLLRVQAFAPELGRIGILKRGSAQGSAIVKSKTIGGPIADLQGSLHLSGVDFSLNSPPMALSGLDGEISLDGQRLVAKGLKGRFLHSKVELSGDVSSDAPNGLLVGKPRRVKLDWKVDGESADFLSLVAPAGLDALRGMKTSGHIQGAGTLSADFGPGARWEAAARSLVMQGAASLKDFSCVHPALPGPLEKVNGAIELKNKELRLKDLRGSLLGSSATVSGLVKGARFFWDESQVDLAIASDVDLNLLMPVLEKRLGKEGKLPPLKGKARSEIHLKGQPGKPESLTYIGDLAFDDLATEFRSDGFNGKLTGLRGNLAIHPDRLVFTGLDFRMGDARYVASGELGRADLILEIQASGPFQAVKDAHPGVLGPFEVGGDIDMKAKIHLALPEPERSIALKDARFPPVFAFPEGAAALARRSFDGLQVAARLMKSADGEFVARDVEMTYCTFPARVTGVNGKARIEKDGFHAPQMDLIMGGYPVVGSGEYLLSPDGPRSFTYKVTAPKMDVKPWYGKWPEPPPKYAYIPLKPGVKPFIKSTTHAFVDIKDAQMGQFAFKNHQAEFFFSNWKGPNNVMEIRSLRAEGYGGAGSATGVITFPRTTPMQWDMKIEAGDIEIREAVEAVFKRKGGVSGQLNTTLDFAGVKGAPNSFRGKGNLLVRQPHFFGPAVMAPIQNALHLGRLGDAVFPRLEGKYEIADGMVRLDDLMMGNDLVQFKADGRAWFDKKIDLNVYAQPLGVIDRIPGLNILGKGFDWVSSALFKFRITGSLLSPSILPIPLSFDKLNPLNLMPDGKPREERPVTAPNPPPPSPR